MTPEPIRNNDDTAATFSPRREDRVFSTSLSTAPAPQRPPSLASPYGGKATNRPKNEHPITPNTNEAVTKKWGDEVSRKDIIIVITLTVVVLIAAVVTLIILIKQDKSDTPSVFGSNQQLRYDFIRESLENSTFMVDIAQVLPKNIGEWDTVDGAAKAFALAAQWSVEVDPVADSEHSVLIRFALATLYYAHGGAEWISAEHWMTSKDTCEWEGIGCQFNTGDSPNIQELDLSSNNLIGTFSPVLSLLQDVNIIWFDHNEITGPIRGDLFASLPNLGILYLHHNQLTGPISKEFGATGKLYTLYLHDNLLTGAWPGEFCPICDEQGLCIGPFTNFGVDCKANSCPCCDPSKNCF